MIDQIASHLKLDSTTILRLITASIGIPILCLIIWFGGIWLLVFVILVALQGTKEFYKLWEDKIPKILSSLGTGWSVLIVLIAYFGYYWVTLLVISISVVLSFPTTFALKGKSRFWISWLLLIIGPIYIGFCVSHSILMLKIVYGTQVILGTIATVFANDTLAYLVGKKFGTRRIYKSISPNKTVEGTMAGLIGSILTLSVMVNIFGIPFSGTESIILGLILGIAAQAGDLLESFLKRKARVKDSGSMLPGHGGILDRLDSIVFPFVIIYYCARSVGL